MFSPSGASNLNDWREGWGATAQNANSRMADEKTPAKRGRGRPKGSTKRKADAVSF